MQKLYFMSNQCSGTSSDLKQSTVAMTEGRTMYFNEYSTNTESQRQRILFWLCSAPLTTTQARTELDVMHPAARVQELRKLGHNIQTHWETIHTGKAKHRVACYVLFAGAVDA